MSDNSEQHIIAKLNNAFEQAGLDAQLKFRRRSRGWVKLTVIASAFAGQSEREREEQVYQIIETTGLHLYGYPFLEYALYTPGEEPAEEEPQPLPLPLWSETLGAPEAEHPVFPNEDVSHLHQETTKRSFVVTFYSFKGNTGQSTALGFVANLLVTSGYRVVMLDFDLRAPGISFLFPDHRAESQQYGVVDYVYERYLYHSLEGNFLSLADCTRRIHTPFPGELYLVPAGNFDEEYLHMLADLDIRSCYNWEGNPFQQLLNDVKTELDPDILLIDAGRGFDAMGAIALLDQADLGLVGFSLTNQNFEGLKLVVQAASRQRSYKGIPDLRFLLTSMPGVAQSQQQLESTKAVTWIAENWQVPRSMSVDELYFPIPYNPNIPTLTNLIGNIESSMSKPYQPVVDAIIGRIWKSTHLRKAI
jgi:cellulose biosynthesis protein BcsQ